MISHLGPSQAESKTIVVLFKLHSDHLMTQIIDGLMIEEVSITLLEYTIYPLCHKRRKSPVSLLIVR